MQVKSIGQIARELIVANPQASNKEVLAMLQTELTSQGRSFETKVASIAWYRSEMNTDPSKRPQVAKIERTAELINNEILATASKLEALKQELADLETNQQEAELEQLHALAAKLGLKIAE